MNLIEEFETTCGWCGTKVPADQEIFGAGAKIHSDVDLSEKAGNVIKVYVTSIHKRMLAAVPGKDSEAKRDGHDLMFMVCSEPCGQALKEAMHAEFERGEKIDLT